MSRLHDAVKRHLDFVPFHYQEDERGFHLSIEGRSGQWKVIVRIREQDDQIAIYSIASFNVPEDRRQALCEFLSRANYGLRIGNYEIDLNDGEIRYKTSIDLEDVSEIPDTVIRNLIRANLATFDRYLGACQRVTFGGVDPKDAVEEAEGRPGSEASEAATETSTAPSPEPGTTKKRTKERREGGAPEGGDQETSALREKLNAIRATALARTTARAVGRKEDE